MKDSIRAQRSKFTRRSDLVRKGEQSTAKHDRRLMEDRKLIWQSAIIDANSYVISLKKK
jgi:hypothetical protein